MEKQEAIKVLLQVAELSQSKGILSFQDSEIVFGAVKLLTVKDETDGKEASE